MSPQRQSWSIPIKRDHLSLKVGGKETSASILQVLPSECFTRETLNASASIIKKNKNTLLVFGQYWIVEVITFFLYFYEGIYSQHQNSLMGGWTLRLSYRKHVEGRTVWEKSTIKYYLCCTSICGSISFCTHVNKIDLEKAS